MIILKILGIILFVVIALILFLILVVFCVPINYKLKGRYRNNQIAKGIINITYLFKIFSITIYINNDIKFKVRIFGKDILKKKKKIRKNITNYEESSNEKVEFDTKIQISNSNINKLGNNINIDKKENIKSNKDKISIKLKKDKYVKKFRSKLLDISNSIKSKLKKVKDSLLKLDIRLDELKKEETKRMIIKTKNRGIKILKHIFPKNFIVDGELGFEDVFATSLVFSGLSLIDTNLINTKLRPNFEDDIINIYIKCSGKIVFGYVIYQVFMIYINKSFRRLIKLIGD